jgi:hypothetical protein
MTFTETPETTSGVLSESTPDVVLGEVTRLNEWLAARGPLSWPVALTVALHVCSRASGMTDAQLGSCLAALGTVNFVRGGSAGWTWTPTASSSPSRKVADAEVIERVGAVLFECLTGQALTHRFAEGKGVLDRLRILRADLPPAAAELVANAAAARGGPGASLAAFALELRTVLGVAGRRPSAGRRWGLAALLVLGALAAGVMYRAGRPPPEAVPGSHGLSAVETSALDMAAEAADGLAVVDEHTAALQLLQEIDRLWFSRLAMTDPRLAWSAGRQAWVRRLAGDLLTTEQLLERLPSSLEGSLGRNHPCTRTARLDLAAILEARGLREAAAGLRADAARGAAALWRSPALGWDHPPGAVPWPPHVVAHVAPNPPEREGFRRRPDDGFFAPVTSTQRLMAGRDGWHLHVRADAACRVTVVAGVVPRGVTVDVRRTSGSTWRVQGEGVTPAIAFDVAPGESAAITLSVSSDGNVRTQASDGTRHASRIDPAAPEPAPPYGVSFAGDRDGAGCAVVWWEITPR